MTFDFWPEPGRIFWELLKKSNLVQQHDCFIMILTSKRRLLRRLWHKQNLEQPRSQPTTGFLHVLTRQWFWMMSKLSQCWAVGFLALRWLAVNNPSVIVLWHVRESFFVSESSWKQEEKLLANQKQLDKPKEIKKKTNISQRKEKVKGRWTEK